MKYFTSCRTIHEAKAEFRRLSKIHHPDVGGDPKIMSDVISEYDSFIPSAQPHDNRFHAFASSKSNRYQTHERPKFTSTSIPFDHPIYVELRELRNKFNYAMEDENLVLKIQKDYLTKEIDELKMEISSLKEKNKKLRSKKRKKKSEKPS